MWLARPKRGASGDLVRALAFSFVWCAALVFSLAVWIRIMIAGEQGRLLFPAAAAVATILVIGWIGWLPRRLQGWAALAVGAGMLALGIWQYQTVQTTYATPPALAAPVTPSRIVDATFSGGMQLVGFDLPEGAATDFSKPLPLTLYFQAVAPVPEDYTLFIHLVDGENRMLYQYDGIPYQGRHPPRQWRAGEIFADHYEIMPKPEAAAALSSQITNTLASLTLGFYPVLRPQERLPVSTPTGSPLAIACCWQRSAFFRRNRALRQGRQRQAQGEARTPRARWQNGIILQDVTVVKTPTAPPTSCAAVGQRTERCSATTRCLCRRLMPPATCWRRLTSSRSKEGRPLLPGWQAMKSWTP